MKKLLPLFIPLVFLFGCEKDNPHAAVSPSNTQANSAHCDNNNPYCELIVGDWWLLSNMVSAEYGYVDPIDNIEIVVGTIDKLILLDTTAIYLNKFYYTFEDGGAGFNTNTSDIDTWSNSFEYQINGSNLDISNYLSMGNHHLSSIGDYPESSLNYIISSITDNGLILSRDFNFNFTGKNDTILFERGVVVENFTKTYDLPK